MKYEFNEKEIRSLLQLLHIASIHQEKGGLIIIDTIQYFKNKFNNPIKEDIKPEIKKEESKKENGNKQK